MMTLLLINSVILAHPGMMHIHLHVETTILATSLQLINAAPVMEEPTLPPES